MLNQERRCRAFIRNNFNNVDNFRTENGSSQSQVLAVTGLCVPTSRGLPARGTAPFGCARLGAAALWSGGFSCGNRISSFILWQWILQVIPKHLSCHIKALVLLKPFPSDEEKLGFSTFQGFKDLCSPQSGHRDIASTKNQRFVKQCQGTSFPLCHGERVALWREYAAASSEYGTSRTVWARSWPRRSGKSLYHVLRWFLVR